MDISSRSRNSHSIGLARDHVGIEGRTLFLKKKERRTGLPESLRDEPEIRSLAAKGVIVILDPATAKDKGDSKKKSKFKSRDEAEG